MRMKILFCRDIMLGAVCAENLDVKQSRKWQTLRTEKFCNLFEKAVRAKAGYIAFLGRVFGQERVPESVIDSLFAVVKENKSVQCLFFLNHVEFNRINYRNDIPENMHMVCVDISDTYTDANILLQIEKRNIRIQLVANEPVIIAANATGIYSILRINEDEKALLSFEPLGFEDSGTCAFGYSVLEWADDRVIRYEEKTDQRFKFETIEINLTPADDEKEISSKMIKLMSKLERDVFLRVNIKGKTAFAFMPNADALKQQFQNKVFYAEVYVNTVMDIDESAFENDISLRSEFVRLALQDDSLSELERNRLICYGWNVLTGREVSE